MTRSDGEGTGFISESKFIANPLGPCSLFLSAQPFPIYRSIGGEGGRHADLWPKIYG